MACSTTVAIPIGLSSYLFCHRAVLHSPSSPLCLSFIVSFSDTGALVLSSVVGVLQICSVSKPFNFIPQLPFSSGTPFYSYIHTFPYNAALATVNTAGL